jgi:hypothetical protein
VIVLLLGNRDWVVDRPSISTDDLGNVELCEDGLDKEDRLRLVYACPDCGTWLFESHELKWASPDGYWKSPAHTLQKANYHIPTETITCTRCKWERKLTFFSYGG